MGKYNNGINGAFSGKIGNVVGVISRGVNYMRSVPEIRVDKPTEKQIRQRNIMAMISSWLKPIKFIINIGFKSFTGGKTPINEVFSLISKQALIVNGNQVSIDYKSVVLSKGELLPSIVVEIVTLIESLLHMKWRNFNPSIYNSGNDKATFVIYNPSKERFALFAGIADRDAEEADLKLPTDFSGDNVHCWMQYVDVVGIMVSTSTYLGEVLVG
jgi:hypothetical protein